MMNNSYSKSMSTRSTGGMQQQLLLILLVATSLFCGDVSKLCTHGLVVQKSFIHNNSRRNTCSANTGISNKRQQQQQQQRQNARNTIGSLNSYSSDNNDNGGGGDASSSNNKGNGNNVLYSFGAEVVPEGQRPVNEYLDMKQAPLFGWGSNEVGLKGLLLRLAVVYSAVFLTVGFPIAGATYTSDGYLLQKIASANVGTLGLVVIVMVRIYSGWGYVGSRLQSKVIEYEETGWYDGNFEPKTEAELKRDKFLYESDVKPAVDRLKLLTLAFAGLWVASCVGLNSANSMKPKFNAYDPRVLNQVVKDEKFANAAAAASNDGRPTYCDSRYYRAIANGGQGCEN